MTNQNDDLRRTDPGFAERMLHFADVEVAQDPDTALDPQGTSRTVRMRSARRPGLDMRSYVPHFVGCLPCIIGKWRRTPTPRSTHRRAISQSSRHCSAAKAPTNSASSWHALAAAAHAYEHLAAAPRGMVDVPMVDATRLERHVRHAHLLEQFFEKNL